jgi:hypothetical protein
MENVTVNTTCRQSADHLDFASFAFQGAQRAHHKHTAANVLGLSSTSSYQTFNPCMALTFHNAFHIEVKTIIYWKSAGHSITYK